MITNEDKIDTSVPHPARRYDYLLGGKDNFAADRASGDKLLDVFPTARIAALHNRAFMHRTTSWLARKGISQFLDVGTGIPTSPNLHEVAQEIAPQAHIAYVDNDPLVLVHARALLTSSPQGRVTYLDTDLRDPESILDQPELDGVLDLSQPVALSLIAVLHFLRDDEEPYELVARLVSGLAPGSYVTLSHATGDHVDPATVEVARAHGITPRSRSQIERFFSRLDLVDPGLVSVADWHPDQEDRPSKEEVSCYGAVAQVPSPMCRARLNGDATR